QRDLDAARAELDLIVEIPELALVPYLGGTEAAVAVLPDAHSLGIVAVGPERRGSGGADPFVAALVTSLLLGQAPAQRFKQLVEPSHRLDLPLPLVGKKFPHELGEPFLRNLGRKRLIHGGKPLEYVAEHAVELVEVALVLDESGTREVV